MNTLPTKSIPICCPRCGGESGKITDGKGPHAGKLICSECDRFIKWLSKKALSQLESGGAE